MSAPLPSTGPARSYPFEATPLVEPVDPAAARAYVQELRRAGGRPRAAAGTVVVIIVAAFVMLVLFGSIGLTIISIAVSAMTSTAEGGGMAFFFALVPLVVIGALIALAVVYFVRSARARAERTYRLDRFARANAMHYVPRRDAPPLPGMIFGLGSARHATDLVRGEHPRFVEFANYSYTTGSGKNRQTHRWGYVAVKLDTPLPHIVLDATSNNSLFGSNLPVAFDKDQRLGLEGDFDQHFALYCPPGYERDALYLFTPDIMARFIDNAAALDVEIVDDWLFLYARRDFSTLDPRTWAWLFSVVGALLDKFAQWARWRDDRLAAAAAGSADGAGTDIPQPTAPGAAPAVPFAAPLEALRPPPGVAAQGRRLQRGVPWVPIIVGGVVVLFWILTNSGLAGLLFGG